MIIARIKDFNTYTNLSEGIATALRWLSDHARDEFTPGVMTLDYADGSGRTITVKCEDCALMPREKANLEAHRRFIDIHVPLKCTETIGWAPVDTLVHPREAYDHERDVIFYGDSAESLIHLKKGEFAIFFPEDSHAPNIGLGKHRKLCIKIPVN